jgi:soluble lytic murein transglycosylase-like protein
MPATVLDGQQIGLTVSQDDNDRDTNITIGTVTWKLALDDLGGSPMAAAVYNAGPGRPHATAPC